MKAFKACQLSLLFSLLVTISHSLYSYEFLYPVAHMEQNGQTVVYVLYQRSISHLELWLWNPETKVATKGLLSTYIPAGLKILPSNNGFSFLDEGRIRIKEFYKRSPKAIEIYESIYDIHDIIWIDDENFYFSAKKDGTFSIFQMNTNEVIDCLVGEAKKDCMYPQIVDDTLFFIERGIKKGQYKREHLSYKIMKTTYNFPHLSDQKFENHCNDSEQQLEQIFKNGGLDLEDGNIDCKNADTLEKECIIDFKSSPISFLKMISEDEGFFLAHPDEVERHDKILTFDYYHIKKNGENWNFKELFSFSLPAHILLDVLGSRLYESIFPLLPRYSNGSLYYVDYYPIKKGNINIFRYELASGITEQKSFGSNLQFFFSPIFVDKNIYFGGCVNEGCEFSPKMWINSEGLVCIDLPSMTLN